MVSKCVTQFRPFPAYRYSPLSEGGDITPLVAPPYDVLSDADRSELEGRHPANSVRLDYPHGATDPNAYTGARADLDAWIADGTIRQDSTPTFTIYRMTATDESGKTSTTTGVIGGLGLEPPGEGDVLPHEQTTTKDKADRLSLIRATQINTSPIWGLSLTAGLGAVCARLADRPADEVAVDDENVRHETWMISDPADLAEIASLVNASPVVIADGHHRFETGLAYLAEQANTDGESNAIMALVVELAEEELDVRGIHRIISLPEGTDPLEAFSPFFDAVATESVDDRFAQRMIEGGGILFASNTGTWLFKPKADAFPADVDLDSKRIALALETIPGASVRYHHSVKTVLAAVDATTCGALLRPATVAQIRAVAASRTRMPAKTTFFWPKPRTGMVFRSVQ